ncbi:hypothetical protein GIB67_016890 [Kingdonia uniflora]|uniref:K Homology domain-containing protein n=1 Tax=Kingdonia uniflora TaxID=39325 RepID=A0A7J7M3C4_9MAGN|nr:hypothetical protein GIB67_016890 [Kingdonia uniflora]
MAAETTENGSSAVTETPTPVTVKTETNTTSEVPIKEDSSVIAAAADKKWPGWPGDNVFRMIVPVLKVGSIIGRKGELIKKMCEETKARIRVLEGALGTADRIVLVSGKEEPDAAISPAMVGVLKIFKRVVGIETEDDGSGSSAAGIPICSIRLLVASSQAINLIGKQGSQIKAIQEGTGASVRVLSGVDEVPFYATSDERIIEIQGDGQKVLKALEAVIGHLRKFLVDHSIVALFEKSPTGTIAQDRAVDTWSDKTQSLLLSSSQSGITNDYPLLPKRESLYLDRESHMESQIQHHGLSLYGQDPALAGTRPSGLSRASAPIVTQITQTMQIPLSYAEDIIGIGGTNIGYIRRTSGAVLTVQESRGILDEITVEIKGTSSQVQTAQQLIQEFMAGHKEPVRSSYGNFDMGLSSSYSQFGNSSYPSSQLPLGGYGSSGVGGYSSYRY